MTDARGERTLLAERSPSRRTVIEWTVFGSGLLIVSAFGFAALYGLGTGHSALEFEARRFGSVLATGAVCLALVAGVIVLHEAIHAAAIRYYGGDVSYGVGVAQRVVPYAYVTTNQRLTRNRFLVVALAPLVVVSVLGVPLTIALEAPVLIVPLAFNAGGSIGDLWMAAILRRYPRRVVVEDSATSVRIYGRPLDEPLETTPTRAFLRRVALGTGVGFGLVVFAALFAPMLLTALGVSSFVLGLPDSPWSVFSFEGAPGDGFEVKVNPVGTLAVSLFVGVLYALSGAFRRTVRNG